MRTLTALASAAIAVALLPATAQGAPACGDVVTEDVRLETSLTGCETGLVVGADGVTVDLGGHAIEGTGSGTGVVSTGFAHVTITNGTIRGFGTGVRLSSALSGTVSALRIYDAGTGILVIGEAPGDMAGLEITGNRVVETRSGGFACRGETEAGEPMLMARNVFAATGGDGVSLSFCPADLVRNVASDNTGRGITRFRSSGRTELNRANDNDGDGIRASDSHGVFVRNVTNSNGGDGLQIRDSIPDHGPFHTVQAHVANANGGYGIFTSLEGVIDGGRNRAHANGEAVQCVGVACK
jgi:Right handed beta helix region